jgi:hypothetical protein
MSHMTLLRANLSPPNFHGFTRVGVKLYQSSVIFSQAIYSFTGTHLGVGVKL